MKQENFKISVVCAMAALFLAFQGVSKAADAVAEQAPDDTTKAEPAQPAGDAAVPAEKVAKEEPAAEEAPAPAAVTKQSKTPKRVDRADAFVAGPDWEFDGFVAGGQDSNVRSMFYLNDLVYVNIGSQHGIATGDKIGIYKRGDKVRDPQTGRFIGYEVRRAAFARATDRVEDETAALRITNTYEAVEIGDLIRREQ